jgi:hypothetical protein
MAAALLRLRESARGAGAFAAVREILSDLVGCEDFGIFSLEDRASVLCLRSGTGSALGRPHIAVQPGAVRGAGAVAAVPLRRGGVLCGALLLFALLPQKPALQPADHAVLEVVATHAAEALLDANGGAR